MNGKTPVALTIAGSDPSGGAGIQADLKTFHQFGVYGEAAITLLTVQNTMRVDRVECMPAELVLQQIRAVVEDIRPGAAKTGALGNREIVEAVAGAAAGFDFPLVVDPVMISKHGAPLIAKEAWWALRKLLLPKAFLLTPNLHEAAALAGIEVADITGMRGAAERLCGLGVKAVLVKGGHLSGSATDVLLFEGKWYEFPGEQIPTRHTHGTGCTYSAAIAATLARGSGLVEAVQLAKQFITEAIRTNPGLGSGSGPVNHHALSTGIHRLPVR
ncbi:MAG TPA: bifunctional hydroxymethylpyrimidine kinase/phosphomethylpyrimidine kinase [Bryobacteraceae bacterium]|nr:bifunctional hydroxymethylpyrimidine kinase/phosphomethylpyrimidine kinase [Bryobacteraceae bacterium]